MMLVSQHQKNQVKRTWSIHLRDGLLLMIIGIYIPCIIGSTYFSFAIFQDEQKRINEVNLANIKSLSAALDSQFHAIESGLIGLRGSPLIQGGGSLSLYEQASYFAKAEKIHSIELADLEGKILFSTESLDKDKPSNRLSVEPSLIYLWEPIQKSG